jgi:hypothetical protein
LLVESLCLGPHSLKYHRRHVLRESPRQLICNRLDGAFHLGQHCLDDVVGVVAHTPLGRRRVEVAAHDVRQADIAALARDYHRELGVVPEKLVLVFANDGPSREREVLSHTTSEVLNLRSMHIGFPIGWNSGFNVCSMNLCRGPSHVFGPYGPTSSYPAKVVFQKTRLTCT